jgi:hypothetical protein
MGEADIISVIMRDTDLFQLALGLSSPWEVKSSIFNPQEKRLDITLHEAVHLPALYVGSRH